MGWSVSWFAIKGLDKVALYDRAHLSPTGAIGDCAGGNGGRTLADGWTLIVLDRVLHPLVARSELHKLSAGCELVACNVEEHVMCCSSEAWKDGSRLWRVDHAGDSDISNLETFGDLPANFTSLKQEFCALQDAEGSSKPQVDYIFEIPLKLAHSITGFKHDESHSEDFELLNWRKPRPWWRFW